MPVRDVEFELLTPRGVGGVAVVELRGASRYEVACRFLSRPVDPGEGPRLAVLRIDGQPVDELLVVDLPAEHRMEWHLHGSPAVVDALDAAVGGFVSPQIGLTERVLQSALSESQLALALEQREFDRSGRPSLDSLGPVELRRAIARSRHARAQVEPRRLVLCGSQNAGKSTLMNRLLFADRVLTGDHPGLTRDPVREVVVLDGYPYEIVDTAGEGEVHDPRDDDALRRAREERRHGLLLLVVDGSRVPGPSDRAIRNGHTLVVRSKADLPAAVWPSDFRSDVELSCVGEGAAVRARAAVGVALRSLRELPAAGPVGGPAWWEDREFAGLLSRVECAGERDGGTG